MSKLLVLFTSNYPNSDEEVFVENEIPMLEKHFDKILIICSVNKNPVVTRYIPSTAEVIVFNEKISFFRKLQSVRFVFSKLFWQEIDYCRNNLKIKFGFPQLKILLADLLKGYLLSIYTKKNIKKHSAFSEVYIYSYWWDYKAVACAFLKTQQPDYISVSRAHGWDIYFYRHPSKYLPMKKLMAERLNAIYFISENGKKYVQEVLGLSKKNLFISRLGTNKKGDLSILKNKSNALLLASCSNLIPLKRIDLIINAISIINDFHISWVHFGDGILKETLQKHAEKLKIKTNIEFKFYGQTLNSKIFDFYMNKHVDLFINVSKAEGVPVSIMEAMSMGIPCIATAVGGSPEIVKDGFNGFLLPADPTTEEIAETIKYFYFLSDGEKNKMHENAYKTWDEKYNAEINYKEFVDKILSL